MTSEIIIHGYGGANVARIARLHHASGSEVAAGTVLFDVENHKVAQEIESPAAGILHHALAMGDLVRLDVPVAFVAGADADGAALAAASAAAKADDAVWDDVTAPPPLPVASSGAKRVSVQKATEITLLGNGAGNSMLSMVGVALGEIRRRPGTADFFSGKILDILVYEASRLLAGKKFRKLNARFEDGAVHAHATVNAGLSFDEGGRLTLYSIEDADKIALPQLQDRIVEGLMDYVGRKLSPAQVATSTFTISDMSASKLAFALPLVPYGQTIIIALTKDAEERYSLFVSFDHRVSEGMVVADFVNQLAARLRSFAEEEDAAIAAAEPEPACSFCGRTLAEEVGPIGGKGLMRIRDAGNADAFCCSTCWGGW